MTTTAEIFAALYAEQLAHVRAVAAARVHRDDRDLVEDITQEAFLRLWVYLERGGAVKSPAGLMGTLTRCAAADHYRLCRNSRERAADFSDQGCAAVYALPSAPSAEDLAMLHVQLEALLTDAASRMEVA